MGRHDRMVLDVGQDVGGFRVESFVARGGMAVVYKARDRRLGRPVALKLIAPELAENPTFRARFIRESELAASLDHPNVLPIYQAGEHDGLLYLAMRFVEGEDLDAVLTRRGRLDVAEALTILGAVAGALDAAHTCSLVHRDVKPGNVLLTGIDDAHGMNLDSRHVYLTDFGLTKRSASLTGLTTAGQFLGTIAYIAPEQIANRLVDHRADIYSLGCVLYHVLSGSPPFARDDHVAVIWAHMTEQPPPLSTLIPGLAAEGDAVLAAAMAKDPEERPATCQELITRLRAAYRAESSRPGGVSTNGHRVEQISPALPGPERSNAPTVDLRRGALGNPAVTTPGGDGAERARRRTTLAGHRRPPLCRAKSASGPPPPGGVRAPATVVSTEELEGPDGPPPLYPPVSRHRRPMLLVATATFLVMAVAAGLGIYLTTGRETTDNGTTGSRPAADAPAKRPGASATATPSIEPANSTGTPRVVGTIRVGAGPQGIAFTPDGSRAYVANSDGRSLSIIDTARRAVIGTIRLREDPQYLAMRPDGKRLFAATHNYATDGGNAVAVVDTITNKPVTWITAGFEKVGSSPYALAIAPDGRRLYVPDHDKDTLVVYDTTTNEHVATVPLEPTPHSVAFDPVRPIALVADHDSDTVILVDTTEKSRITNIPVGPSPHSVAVMPDGSRAFTANFDVSTASVIDLRTRRTIATVNVGNHPRCVTIAPDGRHAYFAAEGGNVLTVVDTTTLKVTASVKAGRGPWVFAVAPDGRTGYLSNRASNTVTVLELGA